MPAYRCKIALQDGQVVERLIQSGSVASVKKTVAKEGGFLVSADKSADSSVAVPFRGVRKVKPGEFYSFNQEFLTLLRAGLPVVFALDGIIEKQKNSYFSTVLRDIRNDISDGTSLSSAFEKYENFFSSLYISVLRSGEAGGSIPDAIEEFLDHFERSRAIRQKIKAASVYPAILTVCSLGVVIFLILYVVPAITGTFVQADAELPYFTRLLLAVSDAIRNHFPLIVTGIAAVIAAAIFAIKTEAGKLAFDKFYLRLPFVGDLSTIYSTALFSSSLSTVLSGGIPLNRALEISCRLVKNSFMSERIGLAIQYVEQGEKFTSALEQSDVFPDMALRMFAAGEEGGTLEKVLKDVAHFYEKEVESRLTIMTSTIEPALMILMGFVIGFIILAMYMPIFQLAGTIG